MKTLAESQVAVVGLGLMGGSLAGALCARCQAVIGVDQSTEAIETAMARAWIKRGTTDLDAGVRDADVVILATPVRVILHLLTEIAARKILCQECLLMDVGSTKVQITTAMAKLPAPIQVLGGHPMCGKEVAGIAAAEASLYQGQTFVLTPLSRTSQEALALGKALVEAVGARPLLLEPQRHDQLVAAASHLPYLLACALVGTAKQRAEADATIWDVVASGFRDTSRLAASDLTMMLDILLTNRESVLDVLETYQLEIRTFADRLRAEDERGLFETLRAIQTRRKELFT